MTDQELEKRLKFLEKRTEIMQDRLDRQARIIIMLMEKIKDATTLKN